MRRLLSFAGIAADAVVVVAVFLPWAGVSAGTATVAGWGSPATPRLLGLFVVAAAATALALRGGALVVDAADRATPHVWAALLDGTAGILTLAAVTGAAALVGSTEPTTPRVGAFLALLGTATGLVAALASLTLAPRRADSSPSSALGATVEPTGRR